MEETIKTIYKNKVIEKFTQVPIEFRDKYMIPNEMELEIMREIWKEAQKELLKEFYNFKEEFDGPLELEILDKLQKLERRSRK
jgi:hypothetical protein